MRLEKYLTKITAGIVFILVLVMYLLTLAPTVQEIDCGELTTAQMTLGICHPTGYPLFTLLGFVWSKIPMPFTPSYKMNLLAALWCTLGATLFFLISKMLFDHLDDFAVIKSEKRAKAKAKNKNKKEKSNATVAAVVEPAKQTKISSAVVLLASACGAVMMGLSKTYWMQSTSVEVYSLQVFMFLLVIWTLLRAYSIAKKSPEESMKAWYFFAAALALSFSNHMTTLLILPSAAYIWFSTWKFNKQSFINIGKLLLVFFPILIILYSYFPIRAGQNPILNWGHPDTWETFYRHVSGWQFRVWLFSSKEVSIKQLSYFLENFPFEFNISAIFIVIGFVWLIMRARKLFIFLLITFLFTVLYSINYDIKDIDSYFLLAYIAAGFFAVFGLAQVFALLHDKKFQYGLGLIAAIVFIGAQIFFTADKVDEHDTYSFEDYTKAVLSTTEKNAVILTYQWYYLVSPAYYVQHILNFRPDVSVIDKELLRRSWYYNQMKTNFADVVTPIQNEVDAFLTELKPFEQERPYNKEFIEATYQAVMTGIVSTNVTKRPVYIGVEMVEGEMQRREFSLPPGYTVIPDLFCFRVVKAGEYAPAADPNYTIRFPKEMTDYTETIKKIVSGQLIRRAIYEIENGKPDRARIYVKKLRDDFPDVTLPKEIAQFIVK